MSMQKKNNIKNICVFVLIIFVWLNSGSVFQTIYASEFQKIICVIGAVLLALDVMRQGTLNFPKNVVGIFLIWLAITSVICMVVWFEFSQVLLYFANFSVFYICHKIVQKVDEKLFFELFLRVITFVAIVSVIGWFFTDALLNSNFGFELKRYMEYKTFVVFNIITTAPNRNAGVFWEPGMYQGFLNFALFIISMKSKLQKRDVFRIVALVWALITTYSTTGYFVLVVVTLNFLYRRLHNKLKNLANVVLIFFVLFFFLVDGATLMVNYFEPILPKDILWKIETKNISYTTRIYSILYDIVLSLKNPFGVGRLHIEQEWANMAQVYGYTIYARTSTFSTAFVYYGFAFGIYYLISWIIGCVKYSKADMGTFLLTFLIIFMILNSEPMMYHIFFTCVLFYWLQRVGKKKRDGI